MGNSFQLILSLSLGLITHFFTPELESLLPLSSSLFWLTVSLLALDLGENIGFQGLLETGMFFYQYNFSPSYIENVIDTNLINLLTSPLVTIFSQPLPMSLSL